jgi:[histone H3]-lysine4 N-trimethyltransferase ASH1L
MVNQTGEWVDNTGTIITETSATPAKTPRHSMTPSRSQPILRKSSRLEGKAGPSLVVAKPAAAKPKEVLNETMRSLRPRKRAASEPPEDGPRSAKKARSSSESPAEQDAPAKKAEPEKRTKKWLAMGLYAGQTRPDPRRKSADGPVVSERKHLPLPMFTGQLLLKKGRSFALPYEVLNPLPKSQAPAWTNLRKSKFLY